MTDATAVFTRSAAPFLVRIDHYRPAGTLDGRAGPDHILWCGSSAPGERAAMEPGRQRARQSERGGRNCPTTCNKGLGYDDYVRGYEYYVIDGEHYRCSRPMRSGPGEAPRIRLRGHEERQLQDLYLADIPQRLRRFGYVWDTRYDEANFLANTWQQGYGLGVNVVTSYDQVMRVEYTVNAESSGPSIYISLNLSEPSPHAHRYPWPFARLAAAFLRCIASSHACASRGHGARGGQRSGRASCAASVPLQADVEVADNPANRASSSSSASGAMAPSWTAWPKWAAAASPSWASTWAAWVSSAAPARKAPMLPCRP